MFSIIITSDSTAWETDQVMRMGVDRFKEFSRGPEAVPIDASKPGTLNHLNNSGALLLYEKRVAPPERDFIRYGRLHSVCRSGEDIAFRFREEGRFTRSDLDEFASRLDLSEWQQGHTHWAIKDGDLPSELKHRLRATYDVVLSFAGEDRAYVEQVAVVLKQRGVRIFYDGFEAASLWGKNLAEHFDWVYRHSGKFFVPFISAAYKDKMWTKFERRSALSRAILEHREYVPARKVRQHGHRWHPISNRVRIADGT
jgi:hypothetical protein